MGWHNGTVFVFEGDSEDDIVTLAILQADDRHTGGSCASPAERPEAKTGVGLRGLHGEAGVNAPLCCGDIDSRRGRMAQFRLGLLRMPSTVLGQSY